MRKIVINTCHGVYSLSNLAIVEYLKLIGKEAFFYKYNFNIDAGTGMYMKMKESEIGIYIPFHVLTVDRGNEFENINENELVIIDNISRDDPKLIYIIEKLGTEAASGNFAELKIVEIPDDVYWVIKEYDGKEWVAEKHRTWA